MNGSQVALVLSAAILGGSIIASSLLLKEPIESVADQMAKLQRAAPAAAAGARAGRPDPNRYYEVKTKGAPKKGSADAMIEIVEFGDFHCPFCTRAQPTLAQIEDEYGDQVSFVFKHLPLRIHPQAIHAHQASEAAHAQGKFWEMKEEIFAAGRSAGPAQFEQIAAELDLDVDKYKGDVASAETKSRIDGDTAEATTLGVTGTPSFFINGRFLSGAQPFESFKRLIDEEIQKKT